MRLSSKHLLPILLVATLVGCNSAPQNSAVDSETKIVESARNREEAAKKEADIDRKPDSNRNVVDEPDQKPKATPKAIAPALQPGTYCYEVDNGVLSEVVRLIVDSSDRVTGEVNGVVTDKAQGYYTSYRKKVDGTIDGSNLNVDVATWIEYDQQHRQETWRVSPQSLTMTRDELSTADCAQAFQGGIEAKDLTASANNVRRSQVFFDAGRSGATVSDSVVRGDRDVYVLGAQGGQQMYLSITSLEDNAVFDVVTPSGIILGTEMTDEMFFLPDTGDYEIIVGGTRGNATYDLSIDIE